MIRRAPVHAAMARLALVAALLLAAVPTLGRLAPQAAQLAHATHAQLVALCTADGLRYVDPATQHAAGRHAGGQHAVDQHAVNQQAIAGQQDGHPGAPPGEPHDHGAPDCAYCPLLLSLLAAAAWLLWLRAAAACAFLPHWPAPRRPAFLHPCGLGSRGPPLAVARLRA